MTNPVPPKAPPGEVVRTSDSAATGTTTPPTMRPRASETAAPAPDDAIVAAADGSSDYAHSDMAEAVDEAQGKVGGAAVKRP